MYNSPSLVYCSAGNIDILSTEGFVRPITVHFDNEVSSSAGLTVYENLLIGQERECRLSVLTGVRIKRIQFRENVKAFPRDKGKSP